MTGSGKKNRDSAVTTAFTENRTFLMKFLTSFFSSRADVEDAVQEAYLRAYVAEQKKSIDQPKAFLFRVAKNVALSKLARKSRQITDYLEDSSASASIDSNSAADTQAEAQETLGLYCEAVAALPDKCREAFLLRKVHGMSHKEIAEHMSLSISSVEKYLRRGLLETKAYIRSREAHRGGETVTHDLHRKIES